MAKKKKTILKVTNKPSTFSLTKLTCLLIILYLDERHFVAFLYMFHGFFYDIMENFVFHRIYIKSIKA